MSSLLLDLVFPSNKKGNNYSGQVQDLRHLLEVVTGDSDGKNNNDIDIRDDNMEALLESTRALLA